MKRLAGVALAAMVACGWAEGVKASEVYVRYDGSANFTDIFGIFGHSGRVFANTPISVVYALNTDNVYLDSGVSQELVNSGYGNTQSAPATILLWGQTFYIKNNDYYPGKYGVSNTNDGSTSSSIAHAGEDGGFNVQTPSGEYISLDADIFANVILSSPDIPRSVSTPFSYTLTSGDIGYGSFPQIGLSYSIARISESDTFPSLVPLPAAAPLFGAALLALSGLGYATRRARVA